MTAKKIHKLARQEIDKWEGEPRKYALAILFCFCYKLIHGTDIMDDLPSKKTGPVIDYQI